MSTLLVIGGAEAKSADGAVLGRFLELAGGGPVAVVTAASQDPAQAFARYEEVLGGAVDTVPIDIRSRADADPAAWARALSRARAVFITGGDQGRLMDAVANSGFQQALQSRVQHGLVVAGTSAGAAVMSHIMIRSGRGCAPMHSDRLIEVGEGLGLWPNVIVDQHFTQRGRIGRLMRAVSEHPHLMGVGIDEDTAVEVDFRQGQARVVGSGSVTVLTARPGGGRDFHVAVKLAGDLWALDPLSA